MKQNIHAMARMLKQLNYILDSRQKRNSIWVFVCMILTAALELLGVSAIYPFLQMMLEPEGTREKWYINWVYCLFPDISDQSALVLLGLSLIHI